MQSFLILYNDKAGKSDNEKLAQKAQQTLTQAGKHVTLTATKSEDDAINQAAKSTANYDCLVTIGGDGSINTVCSGFLKAGKAIPLGIIPGGTVNNFARALHIPLNPDKAINNLVSGNPTAVDLGTVGQHPVVSSLTLGRLADLAQSVKQEEKRKFGPIIYLFKGIKTLFKNRSYKLKLNVDGHTEAIRSQVLLITTTNSVGGYVEFNPEATYDDDYLHVFILKQFTLPKLLTFGTFFLSGQLKEARGVIYFKCKSLKIENLSSRTIKTRIDGDPAVELPIKVEVKPDFLQVILPKSP